jgi:hypothetical protein
MTEELPDIGILDFDHPVSIGQASVALIVWSICFIFIFSNLNFFILIPMKLRPRNGDGET